jgi:O-antigen biosynthesis protein
MNADVALERRGAAVANSLEDSQTVAPLDVHLLPGVASGLELMTPARAVFPPNWLGHIPFAFWLISVFRPDVIVELGVHSGNSYCAFAQAVQSADLSTRCYGIDHWKGDDHATHYGERVYEELRSYHDPRYENFSNLLRCPFDEGVTYFSDGSIDLLHVDGFHTYEGVKHDFDTWLPKMSTRGIMLFHDINVRERGFGVWRFWEELCALYPHFSFAHAYGLGVAFVGHETLPKPVETLFRLEDSDAATRLRNYFALLGGAALDRERLTELRGELANAVTKAQCANDEAAKQAAEHSQEREAAKQAVDHSKAREQAAEHAREAAMRAAEHAKNEAQHTKNEAAHAQARLQAIETSTIWRMTGPLRRLRSR